MRRKLLKSDPPVWAVELLNWACERYGVAVPSLRWNQNPSKARGYAGRAYTKHNRVMVVEGEDSDYNRGSVLHEAAHQIAFKKGKGAGHSLGFYAICWDLLLADGLPLEKMVAGEVSYMPCAWPALVQSGVELSEAVQEVARIANRQRVLHRAEIAVDKAARRVSRSQAGEASVDWQIYIRALAKWKKLDDVERQLVSVARMPAAGF